MIMEGKRQILESVPLLAACGPDALAELANQAEFVTLKKDDLAVREGEKGEGLYVVVSGRLQAYSQVDGGAERIYVRYSSGDWFGEMPLLSGETHWASVRALNDSVLLKIPRAGFETMLRRDPRMATWRARNTGTSSERQSPAAFAAGREHCGKGVGELTVAQQRAGRLLIFSGWVSNGAF